MCIMDPYKYGPASPFPLRHLGYQSGQVIVAFIKADLFGRY